MKERQSGRELEGHTQVHEAGNLRGTRRCMKPRTAAVIRQSRKSNPASFRASSRWRRLCNDSPLPCIALRSCCACAHPIGTSQARQYATVRFRVHRVTASGRTRSNSICCATRRLCDPKPPNSISPQAVSGGVNFVETGRFRNHCLWGSSRPRAEAFP